jgi:DNA polymerase III epsilon subunit-like protein
MRQIVQLGGVNVSTFSFEHTLMLLCVHGATHGWFRLFWLNDVSKLLDKHPDIDWNKLMDHADRLGILRMVAEGLILAALLLDSPLPQKVRKYGQKDKVVDRLVRMAWYCINFSMDYPSMPLSPGYIRKKLYDFRLRNDLQYKLELFLYQIGPAHDEWEAAMLPDFLFPLYFFLKPFSLLYRWHVLNKRNSHNHMPLA